MPTLENHWSGFSKKGISWDVYLGDAYEVLQKFPDESFDCVITSPPYFWLRDYEVDSQIGQEETIEEYVDAITNVMTEVYRILTKPGLLFLNLGDTYYSGKWQYPNLVE